MPGVFIMWNMDRTIVVFGGYLNNLRFQISPIVRWPEVRLAFQS